MFLNITLSLFGQILPKEHEILNYNQIMFSTEPKEGTFLYQFTICEDFDNLPKDNFEDKKKRVVIDSTQATLISNFKFGKAYKWKVDYLDKNNSAVATSAVRTFSIMHNDYNDEQKFKLKQTYNDKTSYKEGIIWCDLYHVAIDRAGKVVWQFPLINKGLERGRAMRDLHLYPNGNLTFITDTNIYYISKDLEVLWCLQDKNRQLLKRFANYHHSFKRLDNGNFIVLQAKRYMFKPLNGDTASAIKFDDDYVVEYNPKGEIVWKWVTSEHFNLNLIKELAAIKNTKIISIHLNSLSVDETGNFIYLGYRDLSRIIKVDKKTKKIVAQYGQKLTPNDTLVNESHLFRRQHDVRILPNNEFTLFNNNETDSGLISSALRLKIPNSKKDTLTPIWEFKLNFDTLTNGRSLRLGSVELLDNGNYLICTGENGRILEVTHDKKPVWDFKLYEKITIKDRFLIFPQYKIAFNSSLFPHYFTFSEKKEENYLNLKINNEGTESDTYRIELTPKSFFSKTKQIISEKINPATSCNIRLYNRSRYKKIKITSLVSQIEKTIE